MSLRVWILGILLIVILYMVWTNREGFQNSLPRNQGSYSLPTAATADVARANFWSILNQQKAWNANGGSTGSGSGSRSGSGSATQSTKDLLNAVINPDKSDTFKVTFPNYISIYALAKYNFDPVAARYALQNNYDAMQGELVRAAQTSTELIAGSQFTSEPRQTACTQLNTLAMSLYGQIINIAATATDLSGIALLSGSMHDENRAMQLASACTGQTGTPSAACIKLASQDETLFPVLRQFDSANLSLLTNGQTVQDVLNTILQTYTGLTCNLPLDPATGPTISSVFSQDYLNNLGTIDTETLSMKLQELSPYYVSPTLIGYISRQLIATSQFNTQLETSSDYIDSMSKVTNAIVSLTTQLAPGKFYDEAGSAGVKTCPAGFYCPPTSSAPLICPVGYYCPPGTITLDDVKCPEGTFTPTGKTDESDCSNMVPAGYYSLDGVATQCPGGNYCPAGSTKPTPCPIGTYNTLKGKSTSVGVCLPCPAGSYCKTAGTQYPTPCRAGSYSSTKSATSELTCLICPAGTKCPSKGLPSATPCPAGTYSGITGLSGECIPGAPGTYSSVVGATSSSSFATCPAGYYCPKGSGYKISCPQGNYCDTTGLSAAKQCPVGRYGNSLNSTNPNCDGPCDAGQFCPPGSVIPNPGQCPAGSYCPVGVTAPILCPAGSYCPIGTMSPVGCPPGTYSTTVGNMRIGQCITCPAASYCGTGTSVPAACPLGYYCPGGNSPPGSGVGAAIPAPGGSYCDRMGMTSHTACPRGTYNNTTGAISMTACKACPAGFYSSSSGQTSCSNSCQIGTYCPPSTQCYIYTPPTGGSSGSSNTISVPIGTVNQIPCPVGYYCDQPNMSKPTPCPVGTYSSSSAGATSSATCQPCEPGRYCPTIAQTSPGTQCPAGTYCPAGMSSPTQCPVGKMCPTAGSSSPAMCPPGTYASAPGAISCTTCPIGTYSVGGLSTTCSPCPAGTYGGATGLTTASCSGVCATGITCPAGSIDRYGNTTTSGSVGLVGSSGSRCPAGVFCPAGSSTTVTCPAGYYCPEGVVSPMLVPDGSYSLAGASVPTPCPRGFYSDNTTMPLNLAGLRQPSVSSCSTCPAIFGYQCNMCPTGTTTINRGTQSAAQCHPLSSFCPPGTYNRTLWTLGTTLLSIALNTGVQSPTTMAEADTSSATYYAIGTSGVMGNTSDICLQCPSGYFCSGVNSEPQLCRAGFYCPAGSSNSNFSYIPGKYCPIRNYVPGYPSVLGLSEPITCPAGTYSRYSQPTNPARTGCVSCPAGYYCPAGTDLHTGIIRESSTLPPQYNEGTIYSVGSQVILNSIVYSMIKEAPGAGYGPELYNGLVAGYDKIWKNASSGIIYRTEAIDPWNPSRGYSGPNRGTALDNSDNGDKVTSMGRVYISRNSSMYSGFPPNSSPGAWSFYQVPIDTPPTTTSVNTPGIICPLGFYCPGGNGPHGSTYTPPPGPVSGSGSASGSRLAAGANISPIRCPPGTSCPAGSTAPIQSPAGYYSPGSGSGTVVSGIMSCPAGYYCPAGTINPLLCPYGYYCPAGSSQTILCPPGYYCPPTGSSGSSGSSGVIPESIICPIGSYCPGRNAQPIACRAGDVCLTTGMTEPYLCPPGSYASSASSACSLCPIGTYSSNRGSSSCAPCPAGSYGDRTGMVNSTCSGLCIGGYYCGQGSTDKFGAKTIYTGSASVQSLCPAGYYCRGGTRDPSSTSGSASSSLYAAPIACPAGYYCPVGTNALGAGSPYSATQIYSLGNQVTHNGSIYSLIKLPPAAGYAPDLYGGLYLTNDKFWRNDSTSTVYNSKVIARWNATTPYNGPANGSALDNAVNGDIVSYNGKLYISRNSVNAVGNTPSASSSYWTIYTLPIDRDASTGQESTNLIKQYNSSTVYPLNSTVFYNNTTYNLIKSPPSAGYGPDLYDGLTASYDKFWQDTNKIGKYTTTDIPPWNADSFYNGPNTGSSLDTPNYGDKVTFMGRVHISRNSRDNYGYSPIAASYMWPYYQLPIDTLNPGTSTTTLPTGGSSSYTIKLPVTCPAGSYCPTGTITPTTCPSGTSCPAGSSSAQQCPAGYYCPNSITRTECPAGSYCSVGVTAPTPCTRAGFYCPAGASAEQACTLGSYCLAGSTAQTPCSAGYYCPTTTTRTQCPAGSFCVAGVTSPTTCASGNYCLTGSTAQTLCSAGYYCPNTTTQIQCPIGSYCLAGVTAPTVCTASGSYCPVGSTAQGQCTAGYYCTNASTQTQCSAGKFCPTGSAAQTTCTAGGYCPVGSSAPTPCPAGSYCATGVGAPVQCSANYYCAAGASSQTLCNTPGKYCPAGSTIPITCPVGTYCPTGSTAPLTCTAGYYCGVGSIGRTACTSGQNCPEGVGGPLVAAYNSSTVYSVGSKVSYGASNYTLLKATPGNAAGYGPNLYDGLNGGYDYLWQNDFTHTSYNVQTTRGEWNENTAYSGQDRDSAYIIYSGAPSGDLVSRNGFIYMSRNSSNYRGYDPISTQLWMPYRAPLLTLK